MTLPSDARMQDLREAGAARLDPVGWHYALVLAERSRTQTGPVQVLLDKKLQHSLRELEQRLRSAALPQATVEPPASSPLTLLLQEMMTLQPQAPLQRPLGYAPPESPQVRQFRQQLRQINVQKRVAKALAKAPQNAGPINSHMLVLRALGVMRDISPAYLNRFMGHVDTLLCLQASEQVRSSPAKGNATRRKK